MDQTSLPRRTASTWHATPARKPTRPCRHIWAPAKGAQARLPTRLARTLRHRSATLTGTCASLGKRRPSGRSVGLRRVRMKRQHGLAPHTTTLRPRTIISKLAVDDRKNDALREKRQLLAANDDIATLSRGSAARRSDNDADTTLWATSVAMASNSVQTGSTRITTAKMACSLTNRSISAPYEGE